MNDKPPSQLPSTPLFWRIFGFRCKKRGGRVWSQRGVSLEPWSPEMFAVEPRAQTLLLLGARAKIIIMSPTVQSRSPRAPNVSVLEPWSSTFFLARSSGTLNHFGTLGGWGWMKSVKFPCIGTSKWQQYVAWNRSDVISGWVPSRIIRLSPSNKSALKNARSSHDTSLNKVTRQQKTINITTMKKWKPVNSENKTSQLEDALWAVCLLL